MRNLTVADRPELDVWLGGLGLQPGGSRHAWLRSNRLGI
jgi:hypothetical protein